MEPPREVPPNKARIDTLLASCCAGETAGILTACEVFITEDEFFQWEGTPQIRRQRDSNKMYFLEKRGIQVMLDLIKNTTDELVRRFAIDVLWAYSETDENRRELVWAGVLPAVCECLKVDNAKVQEGAVGALWQLLEYEPIQTKAIEEGLLDPLLNLLTVSKVTRTQTRAAGCIHLISWNENCRSSMIQADAIEKILSVETTALMVNYFRLLAIGNIMLLPEHLATIPESSIQKARTQLSSFLKNETPEGVRAIENRLMYIWISMKPYVPLVYSPLKEIHQLGMFALANLTGKAENRALLVQEELFDKVLCLGWSQDADCQAFGQMIYKNIASNTKPFEPPSLYAIVFNYLNNHFRK